LGAVIEGRSVIIVLLDSLGKYTRVADAMRIKTWMEAGANQHVVLAERSRVVRADHTVGRKNGRPIFRFDVPAKGSVTLRFQTQHIAYN
jgi:D-alanyl-D-alanine carboxypeptidase